MDSTLPLDKALRNETDKWLVRLQTAYSDFSPTNKLPEKDLKPIRENIKAYIEDAKFFLEKNDLIRAFEAVIYAWGLLESCQHLGLIKKV